tara:strand:- start:1275 stop:1889 length:615 start_codon:yes stop_codon:yes gene_type:complete
MKITLTTAQAVALAKSIAPAISLDPIRIQLHSVQVVTTGEYATFTATDGYRMHQVTVPQSSLESCESFQVGGVELVGALLGTAKAIGKGDGVVVLDYHYGDKVIATGAGMTLNVPVVHIEFPPCASILDTPVETESGAYYHAPYLAEIATAAAHVSGKAKKGSHDDAGMVQIVNIHPNKPMHVTAQNTVTGMQFRGLLMPQRPR